SQSAISGREKHIYSIYKKMVKKHLSFFEIMDVYAFRIIVKNLDDCYRALGIVHSLYKPMPGRFKDYIAIPKINGYQSLHTTLFGPHGVPIEIQIRTEEMDQVANKGIAAHWLYKTSERLDESHMRAQQWITNLLELQQKTGSSLEFVENVKIDLFPDQIYVFTPKGGIFELPRGSTPIDFAYAIHTDIGNSCVSTRIDRQFSPLSTELMTGQTVSIITAPGAHPNPAWLNFVKTAKARSSIRHYLRSQKHTDLITLGKQLLEKALTDLSLSLEHISRKAINIVIEEADLEDFDALCEDVALGNRVAIFVAHQLANASKHHKLLQSTSETTEKPLLIRGTEGIAVQLAGCCTPVPGDGIFGFLVPGHGLMIHRDNCRNIAKLKKHPEKCVLVRWADEIKDTFLAKINVEMSSHRGSFAELTKTISDTDASIEDITINERTGEHYLTTLRIFVRNSGHLEHVLRNISNLKTIAKVIRI
ncbi:MAG: bifunctional (p)ppGpp synthetase/guanosine-3',5'-bis(diphosphate) 3'-pyrophosphohydrolase, partial [Gammaproteobacteria bacterium]|nr:bifunctional (p)ppGpp synthetase/guanosine-3',5'-bis(diphosphate) 3'-pyrophosphohydrolase [Gammaproteobacteria bacterium]